MLRCNINNIVHKTKGKKMNLLNWIKNLFSSDNLYQSRLEEFLHTKNPTTTAELEQWINFYQRRGGFL